MALKTGDLQWGTRGWGGDYKAEPSTKKAFNKKTKYPWI